MTKYHIDIQTMIESELPVSLQDVNRWATHALSDQTEQGELTICLVSKDEIKQLNSTYRKQDKATNVLAFPCELPDIVELDTPLLGDIIICPDVLEDESETLAQPLVQHWAHIVIHGVLHLLGYDHIEEADAQIMQGLEIKLLAELGFDNPYMGEDDIHD